jgi:hypothetical protein
MFFENINCFKVLGAKLLSVAIFGALLSFTAHSAGQYPQSVFERRNNAMGSVIGPNGVRINLASANAPSKEQQEASKISRDRKLLWQAAVAFLASRPMISANYESGTIISDWHKEGQTESKVIVIIQDNPDLAQALKVIAFKRISTKNVLQNATQHSHEDAKLASRIAEEIIALAH